VNATMAAQSGPDQGPFNRFLRWLSEDGNEAVKRYEEIRVKITRDLIRKGCGHADELFDTTIDRVIKIIDRGDEYSNPLALCFGVARNVLAEYRKKPTMDSLDDRDFPSPPKDDPAAHEQKLKCLEKCLAVLSGGERDLLTMYYKGKGRDKIETRKDLATEHGGHNRLRIKAFRIRVKVRLCVTSCLKGAVN
jgi:hypothetical protein